MIFFRQVSGSSMEPLLHERQWILATTTTKRLVCGDVVIADVRGREVIKRVAKISDGHVWLLGDNPHYSTDSREYGWIDKSAIIGRMKHIIPTAQPAPPVHYKYGIWMGWAAAALMAAFAVIHLIRIDTFVPEFLKAVAFDRVGAAFLAAGLVTAEVFSLPYLMRMRLSPLARLVSGLLSVIVPLIWLLIAIWNAGLPVSTAQLGEFRSLPSGATLIMANALWLAFAFATLWALGYNSSMLRRHHGKVSPKA